MLVVIGAATLFQFTPLREGRLWASSWMATVLQFQFTPLREGRRSYGNDIPGKTDFNSRPCVRGDYLGGPGRFAGGISIHAPA